MLLVLASFGWTRARCALWFALMSWCSTSPACQPSQALVCLVPRSIRRAQPQVQGSMAPTFGDFLGTAPMCLQIALPCYWAIAEPSQTSAVTLRSWTTPSRRRICRQHGFTAIPPPKRACSAAHLTTFPIQHATDLCLPAPTLVLQASYWLVQFCC